MKKLIAARSVRTEGQRRGMTYFAAGGGGAGPAKPKAVRAGKKKAGKRGPKKAKAGGPKAEAAPVAAAA